MSQRMGTEKDADGWVTPDDARLEVGMRLDVVFVGNANEVPLSKSARISGLLRRLPVAESPYFVLEVDPTLPGCEDGLYYCTAREIRGTLPLSSDLAEIERWLAS